MNKIKLVLADTDESYLKSLADYLSAYFGDKFQLSYFTQYGFLLDYINHEPTKVDILLICPSLFDLLPKENTKAAIIILSDDQLEDDYKNYDIINKYQSGERIASSLISSYIKNSSEKVFTGSGVEETSVIGVFSASGGVGKTCISVAAALLSGSENRKTFYLNMESASSTPMFFDCSNSQNLSYIYYYIKENAKNIDLRIETATNKDILSNVYYFCPPECSYEWEDISLDARIDLISRLKGIGQYERIFIDMNSCIDSKNIGVLNYCDKIIMVIEDEASITKLESIIKELSRTEDNHFLNKMILVLNKYSTQVAQNVLDYPILCRIPLTVPLLACNQGRYCFQLNSSFGYSIKSLIEQYL